MADSYITVKPDNGIVLDQESAVYVDAAFTPTDLTAGQLIDFDATNGVWTTTSTDPKGILMEDYDSAKTTYRVLIHCDKVDRNKIFITSGTALTDAQAIALKDTGIIAVDVEETI